MSERLTQQYWLLLAVVIAIFLPEFAYAQNNSAAGVLCTVVGWFQGPLGRVIAMLGIMAMGVSVMFGKIQITSLFVVVTGIALIFGAQGILDALGLIGQGGYLGEPCQNTNPNALGMMEKPIFTTLGCLVMLMDSSIARALASLAIIFIGLLAMWGRVSWHQATLVGVGIAVIFGAAGLVDSLGVRVAGTGGTGINISWSTLCPFSEGFNTSLSKAFCNMINWFNGPIGKGVATLGMIIMGIGALFGKVGWDKTIVLGVGVALIFGATGIVDALGGGEAAGGSGGGGRDMCIIGQFDIVTANPTTGTGGTGTGGTGTGGTGTGGTTTTQTAALQRQLTAINNLRTNELNALEQRTQEALARIPNGVGATAQRTNIQSRANQERRRINEKYNQQEAQARAAATSSTGGSGRRMAPSGSTP